MRLLEKLADRIENAQRLDGPATRVQELIRDTLSPGAEQALRGRALGHPLAMVTLPIGAWVSASVLDLLGEGSAARKLTALGCLAALPTATAGAADWLTTTGPQRRTGLVHAAVNDLALMTYFLSWRSRRRGNRLRGATLGVAGAGMLGVGGWLGGHLAYSQGVRVDTNAVQERTSGSESQTPDGMVVVEPTEA